MPYTSIISTNDLNELIDSNDLVIVDCRFNLMKPHKGQEDFAQSHLPRAIYAHLDKDLSGPIIEGQTGRHPLPELNKFVDLLCAWGIDSSAQVIVYDDMSGMVAARLWWMLRWLGHEKVAVLDGGWKKWLKEKRPLSTEDPQPSRKNFIAVEQLHLIADAAEVQVNSNDDNHRLLDARSADRYRGENEIFDVKAGHIPGAISAPCMANLDNEGCFKDQETLRNHYLSLLDGIKASDTIIYCGSGVTAAHDILALLHAGLGDCKLYPGSWSHWITDENRPIALGETP